MRTRILTILFTEECPLHCRYCYIERQNEYNTCPPYKIAEIWESVEHFNNSLNREEEIGRICFTGGEPLLYWEEIKKIIEHYGNQLIYEFNTSAYLLTLDMLDFLSDYFVVFNLSVDGGEKFANWRRPLRSDSGGVGYYKHTKNIFPALTYYFPETHFKVIVTKRCIDLMHEQYLEAESLGFKNIEFVIDLNEREIGGVTRDSTPTGTPWTEEDYEAFTKQMLEIAKEICAGLVAGRERAHVIGIDAALIGLLNDSSWEPVCKVLDNRTNKPLSRVETFCLDNLGISSTEVREKYEQELKKNNYKCDKDENCPFYKSCLTHSCLQDNVAQTGKLTSIAKASCGFSKAFGIAALNILTFGQTVKLKDFYGFWLQQYIRNEVI